MTWYSLPETKSLLGVWMWYLPLWKVTSSLAAMEVISPFPRPWLNSFGTLVLTICCYLVVPGHEHSIYMWSPPFLSVCFAPWWSWIQNPALALQLVAVLGCMLFYVSASYTIPDLGLFSSQPDTWSHTAQWVYCGSPELPESDHICVPLYPVQRGELTNPRLGCWGSANLL